MDLWRLRNGIIWAGRVKAHEANAIVGGLSEPSKMPGWGYGLPARECKLGSKLVKVKGSTCSGCYCLKNRYVMGHVQKAQYRRLRALKDPKWVEAMARLINGKRCKWFRWHDSGDLQSLRHLLKIIRVAELTPTVQHWLPTREYEIVKRYLHGPLEKFQGLEFPPNLTVRLSAHMVDGPHPVELGLPTSGVHTPKGTFQDHFKGQGGVTCPARSQGNKCGECRACWDPKVRSVSYELH